ncbi:MAG: DUF5615 family PIN-like protein [Thermomicrobiales bacterium]
MLVLIDESLPRRLGDALIGHDVRTVALMGWHGTSNGELLRRAETERFDVLISADRNLEFQQNIPRFALGVIVVMVPRTNPEDVLPLVPRIESALDNIKPGRVFHVGADPRRGRSRRS